CPVQEEPETTKYEMEMKLLSETVSAAQELLLENACEKPYFLEEDEVDLCQFTTLGGVYHLDILELPPQCKPMKGWMIVEVREHLLKDESIQNPNWTLLMFSGDRAQSLKINESSDAFSEVLKEETEFHSTLYHMVKDFASQEAMREVRRSNCQFVDSVCHMLLSTRLLSYS
ncbi:CASC1, partial [Cervus elaphus hippelaphus]